MIMIYYL